MKIKISFISLLTLGIVFQTFTTFARSISIQEAITAARHLLLNIKDGSDFEIIKNSRVEYQGILLAYAFELEPAGYVVAPAHSELPPVIAYSLVSRFGETNNANPLYRLIQADLSLKLANADKMLSAWACENEIRWQALIASSTVAITNPDFEQWPASGDGWLKSNWTQNPPYNNMCPMDPVTGIRSYAGCPATAMAQIMNYHGTTNESRFSDDDDYFHNYAGRQYWIDDDSDYADFPSFPELNVYLDSLDAHYRANQPVTNQDKAAMTFACGVAARQVFTSQGSGTFGVDQAYNAYLRFGCSSVDLLDSTDSQLYERLKQNIKDTLPAHLAIVDESWSTGHNVVVDGYNTDEYYHLNFGWGGSYNGWYLLPDEIPYELTVIEGVVVDIQKGTMTGVEDLINLHSEIMICPNPVHENATVHFNLQSPESVCFHLYNSSGEMVLTHKSLNLPSGNHSFSLDLSRIPAGFYIYSFDFRNESITGKLIKAQ